jgi:hypothetical protein
MKHELKIWPQFYKPVSEGRKTFEIRKNDRGFQAGDWVSLNEWEPSAGCYTGAAPLCFTIGYVLPVDAERVVFSLIKETP